LSGALGVDRRDLAAVTALVRRSGTSFYRGMRILPRDRRAAMFAIYGFCRVVDDIADEPGPVEEKRAALEAWRIRVRGLARGETSDALTRVLLAAQREFSLREEDFLAVIDGMQTDAETVVVAPDFVALDLYCDRVASAVGRLSVRAFGDASTAADEVAHHLGRALQLTNILRDLGEDAARGRLYLPREWLEDAGVPRDAEAALRDPRLAQVCERAAKRAHAHFGGALAAMARCDRRAMRPARLMAATYAAILARLERRGWREPGVRVSLPKVKKLWIALRYGLAS
jgi:phytoene synthase